PSSRYSGKFEEGPAAQAVISLSQAMLAPIDALLKAQTHSARSFLSFVLQLGYPHRHDGVTPGAPEAAGAGKEPAPGATSSPATADKDHLYLQEFTYQSESDGKVITNRIKIPALALVPVSPLSISEAEFDFDFRVSH